MESAAAVHMKGREFALWLRIKRSIFFDEIGGGIERSPPDGALGDEREEAFDLVEPGGVGWREVNVPTRTAGEPGPDFGMLVSGVVVDDEMDVQLGRHVSFDMTQEGEELRVAMAGFALSDDCAIEHVEGGKQGGRAMTLVVVGDAFDVAEPQLLARTARLNSGNCAACSSRVGPIRAPAADQFEGACDPASVAHAGAQLAHENPRRALRYAIHKALVRRLVQQARSSQCSSRRASSRSRAGRTWSSRSLHPNAAPARAPSAPAASTLRALRAPPLLLAPTAIRRRRYRWPYVRRSRELRRRTAAFCCPGLDCQLVFIKRYSRLPAICAERRSSNRHRRRSRNR